VRGVRVTDLESYRRICKTLYDKIDKLKARNRELEEKLLLVEAGKRDTVPEKQKSAKCMVVGDSVVIVLCCTTV
jgi:hypothetical protein